MKWKPVRNENYSSRDIDYQGECSNFNESATLSIHLSGKQIWIIFLCKGAFQCRTYKALLKWRTAPGKLVFADNAYLIT